MPTGPIVLLTDFGTRDTYTGVMKGVIAGIHPEARTIDLTHDVPPGDVRQGAFQLWQAARHFPVGSVFLAVVDPGVGTARRALAVACGPSLFVAPDNGLLTFVLAGHATVRAIELPVDGGQGPRPGATFHGRDVFAPAAARLALGQPLDDLGPAVTDWVRLPLPHLDPEEDAGVAGEVVHVDRFGNLITSIGLLEGSGGSLFFKPWLPGCPPFHAPARDARAVLPSGRTLPLGSTFGAAAPGEALAYVGSDGLLEIAVNQGRADETLRLSRGAKVALHCQARMEP
jgi:S-adenosylmethionine hydrolase